ncbi:MAG TPA: outer membrane lipoprotein-sorting protein [Vicinamibacteria bacterium]|nr:outer membrane lipoprotein-sorting protein [Vicinamibacteria bacterium]
MIAILFAIQLSAGAVVARVKEGDLKIHDLQARTRLELVSAGETKSRSFDLLLKRDGVDYRALIVLREPETMKGTTFLVHAARGERNRQWAYFPDLDLVREIAGKSQDDSFLGSDITYGDLAGGAHLDDLLHRLVGEEAIDGAPCYVMEGVPRHRIAYGKLRGWVRMEDFVTVKVQFFDEAGALMKEARISDIRELDGGAKLGHRIELVNAAAHSRTVLTFSDVVINQGLSDERFREESFPGR